MIRLLQVNKYSWTHLGGIERVVGDIAKAFLNTDIEAQLLCINDPTYTASEVGIISTQRNFQLFGMPISWEFFRAAKQEFTQADLILLHHPFPLGFLAYWLYGRNKPLLIWYHSDIVKQRFVAWLLKPLFGYCLKAARFVIVSDLAIAKNSRLLSTYKGKLVAIPFAQRIPNDLTQDNHAERIQLLAVGRLVYYKGYEYLIRAMQGLTADLVIIGTGPLRQDLEELVKTLGLENVQIIPPVTPEDLTRYYRNCDVFILPSVENSEAFGLVQLEAMSYGKPVINTNLPTAVPSVSLNGVTGITVQPKDVLALRAAIQTLLTDTNLRNQYGSAARKRVESNYSFERFQLKLKELVNEALGL